MRAFDLVSKSTTLDDPTTITHSISQYDVFGVHHENLNENRPILSAAEM